MFRKLTTFTNIEESIIIKNYLSIKNYKNISFVLFHIFLKADILLLDFNTMNTDNISLVHAIYSCMLCINFLF